MLLELDDIHVHYDGVPALKGISLGLEEGGFITLIGSNGAGKSTTLKTISGLLHPVSGEIRYDGKPINKMTPDKVLRAGIAHVPEGRRVFPGLSVGENLQLGAFTRKDKSAIARDLDSVYTHFPRLKEREHQTANTLSGGEQQMLAIGRALMSDPRLLLLDEPSLGIAPIIVQEIARILVEINKRGVSVILVEQNAELALRISQYGFVLETGRIALHDESKSLMDNQHVRKAYLGI